MHIRIGHDWAQTRGLGTNTRLRIGYCQLCLRSSSLKIPPVTEDPLGPGLQFWFSASSTRRKALSEGKKTDSSWPCTSSQNSEKFTELSFKSPFSLWRLNLCSGTGERISDPSCEKRDWGADCDLLGGHLPDTSPAGSHTSFITGASGHSRPSVEGQRPSLPERKSSDRSASMWNLCF